MTLDECREKNSIDCKKMNVDFDGLLNIYLKNMGYSTKREDVYFLWMPCCDKDVNEMPDIVGGGYRKINPPVAFMCHILYVKNKTELDISRENMRKLKVWNLLKSLERE